MTPEERAREQIDEQLEAAGWKVQDRLTVDLGAGPGVAVREFTLETGEADYVLFVGRKACGVIEAKPEGTTLSGVADQTGKYQAGVPDILPTHDHGLRFAYESTGTETLFRDERDPVVRSRRVFAFHRPETLQEWLAQPDTLRGRLTQLPPLVTRGLRGCQVEAITSLEKSFAEARPRALIQMASGGGKTFTAVTFSYRLIKHVGAKRVLFLVDRNNLGRQTRREYEQYATPDDGRKFTELYNVQHLTSNTFDPVSRVCITTIQRLKFEEVIAADGDGDKARDAREKAEAELVELEARIAPLQKEADRLSRQFWVTKDQVKANKYELTASRYRQLDHDDQYYEKPETTLDRLDVLSARAAEVASEIRRTLHDKRSDNS